MRGCALAKGCALKKAGKCSDVNCLTAYELMQARASLAEPAPKHGVALTPEMDDAVAALCVLGYGKTAARREVLAIAADADGLNTQEMLAAALRRKGKT